jgi:choline dehydrogenase-like flavoprotein
VVTPSELTLRGLLRVVGAGLLFAAVVYLVGGFIGGFFRELPFVANSVVKVTVLGLACLYAAGNVRGRRAVVAIVIAAHLVSVTAMAVMLLFADTGRTVDLWLFDATITGVLWGAIVLDGVITLAIGVVFALTFIGGAEPPIASPPEPAPLTGAERRLRVLLLVLAGLLTVAGLAIGAAPLIESTDQFAIELPFVTNSVVMCAALAMLAAYAALPVRRNMPLVTPVVIGLFLSVAVQLAYLIPTSGSRELFDGDVSLRLVLAIGAGVDLVLGIVLLLAYRQAWRRRYGLSFLWPGSYRALQSMADVLVTGAPETITPRDVADNVEAYVREITAHRRWVYRLALYGMQLASLTARGVPLSELEPGDRRAFLERNFRRLPRWPAMVRNMLRAGIRVGQQLSFAGYYNDPRTDESVGYRRFKVRMPDEHKLRKPLDLTVDVPDGDAPLHADVCIVGSGAGGAIVAYELAEHGLDVLVLERGRYVEPRTFDDNEVGMIGKLYADGVMQQTEDFNFTVLQGSCVGGSTTVNNAVCFRPPEHVLRRWNDPNTNDAGLDVEGLAASVEHIERFLPVTPQPEEVLNPSWRRYQEGAERAGLSPASLKVGVVNANIDCCLGCGYCNIGCAYGHKLSMLDRVLPEGQRKGRLRIVADCEVERIRTVSGSPRRVAGLLAKLRDGPRVRVTADRYVLSAGAVGSSYLLLRSNAAADLPVGERLCFNMGAPLTAEFRDVQDAYAGLQISHYGIPRDNGFVFETWFNPPVAQALNMPGWFEQHFENMRRYPHLAAVGVLVGTEGNARVTQALTGGPGIEYTPAKRDLTTLARGLRMLGEILFAGGARRVMLNSWGYEELTNRGQLDWIDQIAFEPGYLALGTGHPQGGNAMSRDPRKGVVGPDFRVHGYRNLYIADASVIPSSLTVNPQLTVMGLAHHAAQQMKAAW